jgi:signal transduction histidine kinase
VNRFLGRPQLLSLAVAVVVAALVLIVGQASEDETRARLRAAQVESATRAADAVSASFADRLALIRTTLAAFALGQNPEDSPIGLATQRGDVATLQAITDSVQRLYPRYVLRTYIATRGAADTMRDGMIVAASPVGSGLVGQRLPDVSGQSGAAARQYVANLTSVERGIQSSAFAGTAVAPTRAVVVVTVLPRQVTSGLSFGINQFGALSLAVLVAEIDYARTFAHTVASSLAEGDDAYVVDEQRRLLGRARGATPYPLVDLSADAFVQLIGPTTPVVARTGVPDPLGAGTRLIASAPLYGSNGADAGSLTGKTYEVLLVRDTSAIDREVDTALGQLTAFRLVVVVMLLGLAYAAGLAGSQRTLRAVDQERLRLARDLHDLLGHSLSLITIKSQLAHRLLASSDPAGATSEIGDIERVARESLGDVRHAVDGYRQPTFRAALAGARAALSAAGIASTVEQDPGPMPAELDTALAWAVREGVTNVIRHSHATTCSIRLTRDGLKANLEITDDGATTVVHGPGNGLRGVQERAAARGGHAEAGPLRHGGFQLRVSLPLSIL